MFSDYNKFSPQERSKYAEIMDNIYKTFVDRVSKGRNLTTEHVDAIGQGRVWAGGSALKHKLIDEHGGIVEAVASAKELANISPNQSVSLITYPKKPSIFEYITSE